MSLPRTRSLLLGASRRLFGASTAQLLARYPATKVTTLPNGLRVATEEQEGQTATVGLWVNSGTRHEAAEANGAAHFLEHIFFKGTGTRTRKQLESEIENMGAHLNAFTSREQTAFYAQSSQPESKHVLTIIADLIQNSQFSNEAVDNERGVILREMESVESNLQEVLFDKLHEVAFRGHPLANNILGTVEKINTITRDDILNYYNSRYIASNLVVVGAGAIKHEDLVQWTKELFNKIPEQASAPNPLHIKAQYTGSDIRMRYDSMDRAHIAFGFKTPGWTDPDHYPLMVIGAALGTLDSTRPDAIDSPFPLARKLAEHHAAFTMTPFNTTYTDIGLFGAVLTGSQYTLQEMMWHVTQEFTRFAYSINPDVLTTAKNQLKMNLLASHDSTSAQAEDIGRQILAYNRRIHPLEIIQRIDAVDAGAVRDTARRLFYDNDHALAAVGPIYELPDYMWLRRNSYWLRY